MYHYAGGLCPILLLAPQSGPSFLACLAWLHLANIAQEILEARKPPNHRQGWQYEGGGDDDDSDAAGSEVVVVVIILWWSWDKFVDYSRWWWK